MRNIHHHTEQARLLRIERSQWLWYLRNGIPLSKADRMVVVGLGVLPWEIWEDYSMFRPDEVDCPQCGAPAGRRCTEPRKSTSPITLDEPHMARITEAEDLTRCVLDDDHRFEQDREDRAWKETA